MPRGAGLSELSGLSGGSLRSAPLVATGSVVLEPSSDRTWGNDFFSDAYWQRHDSRRFFQQEPVQPPRRAFR